MTAYAKAYPNLSYLENPACRSLQKNLIRLLIYRRYRVLFDNSDSHALSLFRSASYTLALFDRTYGSLDPIFGISIADRLRMFAQQMRFLEYLVIGHRSPTGTGRQDKILVNENQIEKIFSIDIHAKKASELHGRKMKASVTAVRAQFEFKRRGLFYDGLLAMKDVTIKHQNDLGKRYQDMRAKGDVGTGLEQAFLVFWERLSDNEKRFTRILRIGRFWQ